MVYGQKEWQIQFNLMWIPTRLETQTIFNSEFCCSMLEFLAAWNIVQKIFEEWGVDFWMASGLRLKSVLYSLLFGVLHE